jgi:hypothetical protein
LSCRIPALSSESIGGNINLNDGIIGISDHGGWAILVTASGRGELLDRRRIALVDEDLPKLPHHSEGQKLPLDHAVELVERVRLSADRHARLGLDAVAAAVDGPIVGIAMRQCPPLPKSIAERIQSYQAQTKADTVMYREALAAAAEARGWRVHWYDARKVVDEASRALRVENLDAHFAHVRNSFGAPWAKDHRISMAAAICAMNAGAV